MTLAYAPLGVTMFITIIGMIWVTLCCAAYLRHLFNKPNSEAGLLNKSPCLAPALGVTKFIIVTDIILVALCCAT